MELGSTCTNFDKFAGIRQMLEKNKFWPTIKRKPVAPGLW